MGYMLFYYFLEVISLSAKRILIIFVIFLISSVVFIRIASYMDKDMERYFKTKALLSKPRPKAIKPSSLNPAAVIDASSYDDWAYFDFSKGKVVEIDDLSSLEWDIAFKRNKFISNGGRTNPKGKVGIINLGKRDINGVKSAPVDGYIADTIVRGDMVNKAIGKWYDYSTRTSTLTSKGDLYIIRTADNGYAKMKILGYYCEGAKAACYTIEYVYDEEGRFN